MSTHEKELAEDILHGGGPLALFMFGDKNKRRRVYHLAESKNPPPFFKMGNIICGRKSTLLRWIAEQEQAARHIGAIVFVFIFIFILIAGVWA